MVPMRHVARGWPVLLILVAWIVLGPIAMAFDSCAAMMALCDGGPCGVVVAVTLAGPSLAAPATLVSMSFAAPDTLPGLTARALEPPPKSRPLSA
jgi:hypothetical protein